MSESAISLLEFNRRIGRLLQNGAVQRCWIFGETSDVMVRGGHCYLELVQKNPDTGQTVAKARAIIWANRFYVLRSLFEETTGQAFGNGLNVMVEASANFHEQFGFSLLISDINPSYTLGDMARQRMEIIARLKREGIIDRNKALQWAEAPQRVAIVSAQGAAGYGDFMNQLHHNATGIQFYTCLFPAVMQGANTVPSVMAALARVEKHKELFDCVVVIRGGGSTSDLNSFDNYDLAAAIACFPLPVIVGIGHDRDNTVVDEVANVRVKTPTAAAEWLIAKTQSALDELNALSRMISDVAMQMTAEAYRQLSYYFSGIPLMADKILVRHQSRLKSFAAMIPTYAAGRVASAEKDAAFLWQRIKALAEQKIEAERVRVDGLWKQIDLLSPERVLKRGYSLTLKNGKAVADAAELAAGDEIVTHFASGKSISIVK